MGAYAGLYEKYRGGYQQLWDTLKINPSAQSDIDRIANAIAKNRPRYQKVEQLTGVPWYAIGAIHNLEASLSFGGHFHNGDPLTSKTSNVPSGRPITGSPPYSWEDSAIDAIRQKINEEKKWSDPPDWGIAAMLFKLELYNGMGYKNKGISTPYLWAGTNQYTSGKYVADGNFSASAVSTQRGAAAVISRMMQMGLIDGNAVPSSGTPTITGDYGTGCVDSQGGGTKTLSMTNPQTQDEALQTLLGLDARARSQVYTLTARLNPASMPALLDLDIQKTLTVKGVDDPDSKEEVFGGEYTCDDVIFTLDRGWEVEIIAYKGDPNQPPVDVFLHQSKGLEGGNSVASAIDPTAPSSVIAGDNNQKIYQAALQSKGQSSASGPGGGNVACAWCINNLVLPKAGIKTIGSNPDRVDSVEEALKGGRGQLVNPRDAIRPGDIIIMGNGDKAHIGIAIGNGGNPTLSNSSSKAAFVWSAEISTYDKYYSSQACRAYRVLN